MDYKRNKIIGVYFVCFLALVQIVFAVEGQDALIKSLEIDLQYYERVVKPIDIDSRVAFLKRLLGKYEHKGIDSMYLIPVEEKLENLKKDKKNDTDYYRSTNQYKDDEYGEYQKQKKREPVKRYSKPVYKSRRKPIRKNYQSNSKFSVEGYSGEEDVKSGLSVSLERIWFNRDNIGYGLGLTYQNPRALDTDCNSGKFSYIPIYFLVKNGSNYDDDPLYFIGQVGLSYYTGDDTWKGDGSLSGGLYYGVGIGIQTGEKSQLEILYSVNRGEGSWESTYLAWDPYYGYYYETMSYTVDVEYSKISISYGYKF